LEFQGFSSDKKTYKRTWRFLSVTPESLDGVSNKELRDIIKEALDIYGESGISSLVDRKNVELILENF
jgi:RNase P/RNase MRP subunit POP5